MNVEMLKDATWLAVQYHDLSRSLQDIADELGTNRQRVRRALIRFDIKIRTKAEAQKMALESGRAEHPTEGRHRSKETKLKIAEGVSKDWADADEATLKERSEKAKRQWELMTPEQRQEMQRLANEAVRAAAKDGSKLEKALQGGLTNAGYDVSYHVEGLVPGSDHQVDMIVNELSVAIEVDGPSHFLPIWGAEALQKTIYADLQKNGALLAQGMVVLRVKQLASNVSRLGESKLVNKVLAHLENIRRKYPDKDNRFIEIEV